MATVTTYILTDSLDERVKNDVEDVVFYNPLTGQKLEIQLGKVNRDHLTRHLEKLQKYIDAATVVEVPVVETKPKAAVKNSETTKIREWARANGFEIGDRGRIKAEILEAYKAAHEVIDSTEQPAESDAEPAKLVELSDEAPEGEQGPSTAEVSSTEEEIMAAFEAGAISEQAVMELLDEVTGDVDDSNDQE